MQLLRFRNFFTRRKRHRLLLFWPKRRKHYFTVSKCEVRTAKPCIQQGLSCIATGQGQVDLKVDVS